MPTTARGALDEIAGPVRRPESAGQEVPVRFLRQPDRRDQYHYNQNVQVIEDDSVDTDGVAQSIDQYVGVRAPPVALAGVGLHDGKCRWRPDERRLLYRLAPLLPDRRQRQRHDDD